MALFIDMLPSSKNFSDKRVTTELHLFTIALKTGNKASLSKEHLGLVHRVEQAIQKVQSGKKMERYSELNTLAQYGAGSVALFLVTLFETKALTKTCETLFIARFLVQLATQADTYKNLLPEDFLETAGTKRCEIGLNTEPLIFNELFSRAASMIEEIPSRIDRKHNKDFCNYLYRHKLLTQKYIQKLYNQNPIGSVLHLSWWEILAYKSGLRSMSSGITGSLK